MFGNLLESTWKGVRSSTLILFKKSVRMEDSLHFIIRHKLRGKKDMKKNELRIDNILMHGERLVKVNCIFRSHFTCIDFSGVELGNSVQENFSPVPLTKRWLLDFGFRKMQSYGIVFYIEIKNGYLIVDLKANTFSVSNSLSEFRKGEYFEMKNRHDFFVHRLQNLYFELNEGEEELIKKTL